jgi:hypothetical protein
MCGYKLKPAQGRRGAGSQGWGSIRRLRITPRSRRIGMDVFRNRKYSSSCFAVQSRPKRQAVHCGRTGERLRRRCGFRAFIRKGFIRNAVRSSTSIEPSTAALPVKKSGRLLQLFFRGLLSVHSRYGLHARRVAKRPSTPKAPTASLPPLSLRLLPGGANQFTGGSFTRCSPSPFTAHRFANNPLPQRQPANFIDLPVLPTDHGLPIHVSAEVSA